MFLNKTIVSLNFQIKQNFIIMGTTTVKKQPTASETKVRNPKVYNEYYDLLKDHNSKTAKEILAEKYNRSFGAINTILVNVRKKRKNSSAKLKSKVAA